MSLLEELETLIPEAQAETAGLIPPVRCQKRSSDTKDIPLAIKCLDFLAPRAMAGMIVNSQGVLFIEFCTFDFPLD